MSKVDILQIEDLPERLSSAEQKISDIELGVGAIEDRTDAIELSVSKESATRQSADTSISSSIASEAQSRIDADSALGSRIDEVEGKANTALQPNDIDYTVVSDISLDSNASTTVVKMDANKTNLKTGASSGKEISLPVASSSQAGVVNAATFSAIQNSTEAINVLQSGAQAITGLPENPTQENLSQAWKASSGKTAIPNGASILDVSNSKKWEYYTNDTTWHEVGAVGSVTVNQATNSSLGTVMGSENDGQVFVESNGTQSVNGWDSVKSRLSTAETKLSGVEAGAQKNVKVDWAETDINSDAFIYNKPTIPSKTSELTNDSNFATNEAVAEDMANVYTKAEADALLNTKNNTLSNAGSVIRPAYIAGGKAYPVNTWSSGNNFQIVPYVGADGVMEIGKIIDFHATADGTSDKDVRVEANSPSAGSLKNTSGDVYSSAGNSINTNAARQFYRGVKSGIDLDTLLSEQSGYYVCISGCTNTPIRSGESEMHWYILNLPATGLNANFATQIATAVHSSDNSMTWVRRCVNGTWSAWVKLVSLTTDNKIEFSGSEGGIVFDSGYELRQMPSGALCFYNGSVELLRVGKNNNTGLASHRLVDVGNPVEGSDAVNKSYVDGLFAKLVAGTTETYNIENSAWTAASDIAPYKYSTVVTSAYTITDNTMLELYNNDAVAFAKYGFAIGKASEKGKNVFDPTVLPESWSSANQVGVEVQLEPNTTYTMSSDIPLYDTPNGAGAEIFFHLPGAGISTNSNGVATDKPVTLTTGGSGKVVITYRANTGDHTITRDDYWYQIEEGSTATAYTPFTGDGHSVTLYALDAPTSSVTLKINYKETA